MSKPLVWLSALVGAGLLAVTAGMYLGTDSTAVNVRFDQGKTTSRLFVPPTSQKEVRIVRHPNADGSAVDDVLMRDGTTKHIIYDTKMTLRQVFAYFKGPTPDDNGPLMYEKTHDTDGHLVAERHLRLDGSLEMDGLLSPAGTYVRHLYYPLPAPGASSDPTVLVVASEQTFDKFWNPISQTDYRSDRTKQLAHTWSKDQTEVLSSFAADGLTLLWQETTKQGTYDRTDYKSDGDSVAVETINYYGGTTFQWYHPDHTLALSVKFDNTLSHEVTLMTQSGKPLIMQVWSPDYSAKAVDGQYPQFLSHVDHFNDAGKMDIRYMYGLAGKLSTVIVLQGDDTFYGARQIYTIDADGWATKVETFDDKDKSDGGKALTRADGKHFALESWMVTLPTYELPKLKEGLKLYGEPPQEGPY